MNSRNQFFLLIVLFIIPFILSACLEDEGESTGFLTVEITDAPLDHASAVVLQLGSIEIKPAFSDQPVVFEYEDPGFGFELDKFTRGTTLTLFASMPMAPWPMTARRPANSTASSINTMRAPPK